MDNNQTQTTNNIASNPIANTTNANVFSDVLNTQQIDPFSIPKDQMTKDLELLKKNDVDSNKDVNLSDPTVIQKPNFVPFVKMEIKDIDVLKLKNPFKGM